MKLLFSLFNVIGRGTYWRALHLAHQLAHRGHKVDMLVTSPYRRWGLHKEVIENINIVATPDLFSGPLRSGWDAWNVINRVQYLRSQEYDLVHSFECRPVAILPALYLKRNRKIPFFTDWSDWFGKGGSVEERPNRFVKSVLRPVETYFEEHFRKEAIGTTVICSALHDRAISMGLLPTSLLLLNNGADTEKMRSIPIHSAREQLGFRNDDFIIGFVGSIFHRDAQFMIQALNLVNQQITNSRLLVAGYCQIDIRSQVMNSENVFQTGPLGQEDLNCFLAACDVFWLPFSDSLANRGRLPMKIMDYLAVGRPTIATEVGDITEIFRQAQVGFLVRDSPQDLVEKTNMLYLQPHIRSEMGQNARNLAETKYDWRILADKLESFYLQMQSNI